MQSCYRLRGLSDGGRGSQSASAKSSSKSASAKVAPRAAPRVPLPRAAPRAAPPILPSCCVTIQLVEGTTVTKSAVAPTRLDTMAVIQISNVEG